MDMNKKDRIAVVLSIPLLFIGALLLTSKGSEQLVGFMVSVPLFCYWGYRFIKNDISFLKIEDDKG
jgi:hypothetical protein